MDNSQENPQAQKVIITACDHNNQLAMLLEIQQLQFIAIELNLYLDTHPDDQQALMSYNSIVPQLKQSIASYEQLYGPLFHFGLSTSQLTWQWINSPWPWDM
jgi:spore coat protein JB